MRLAVFLLMLCPMVALASPARDPVKCGKVMIGRVKRANQLEKPSMVRKPRGCPRVRVESPYWFEVSEDGLQTLYEGGTPIATFGFREDAGQAVIPAGDGTVQMYLRKGGQSEWKRAGFE